MSNIKLLLLFFLFITFASSSSCVSFLKTTYKCPALQKYALLRFKQSLFSFNDTFYNYPCQDYGYYPIMMTWKNDIDCCNWDGVSCNPFTGDVIGIDLSCGMLNGTIHPNTTLFHLPHLQRLNLAFNVFFGSQLPREIGKLSGSLTHLNLSYTGLSGEIPSEILFLSKLVSLDLFRTYFYFENQPQFLSNLFQNCSLLEDIWLRKVGLHGYLPTHLNTSSLKSVDLGFNYLKGRLPDNIFNLQHLETLDLSNNYDVTGPFPKVNRSISLSLKWLHLGSINLSGEIIPDSIGHFKSLTYLGLVGCGLVGSIPKSIVNLRHLTTLYISNNMLNGTLPSFFTPSIEYIYLSINMFTGGLPLDIFNCRSLKTLSLSNNLFDGLLELDTLLSTLPKLISLDLSYSGLSVVTTKATHNYVNPNITMLSLTSCNLTVFPESIRSMKKLEWLDLSDNEIRGPIPDWAGEIGGSELRYVNLSHNSITGLPLFHWYQVTHLSIQSNQIQGPFPPSICNMTNLQYLDVSNNSFGGVIPECLRNNTYSLHMINLRTNHFNGIIPNVFKDCVLRGLILNGNHLVGELPSSLSKCQRLEILDLGNNQLNGTFPQWLGDLQDLHGLVLKSNNLEGTIGTSSSTELPFQSVQVLDLSHNGFIGHLPQNFQNFIAMKDLENTKPTYVSTGTEYYSIIIAVKGQELDFQQLLVNYTIIYLSNNRFVGEIPNVIGSLNSLIVLNLSHNSLTGRIPHDLGKLSEIESLDLSCNQLTGEIPQSLTDLTFLGYLNLSQNDLKGRIPQGKQFNTFGRSSFEGNPKLCGIVLPKKCIGSPHEPQAEGNGDGDDDEEKSGFTWKVVMFGYGCGTLLGLVIGFLMVSIRRPKWFNEIYYAMEHMILKHMILKRRNKRRYTFSGK